MNIDYKNSKIQKQCTELREAKKRFPEKVASKLIKLINFIESAENLEALINYSPCRFHDLKGNNNGLYSMDIDGKNCVYRLIVKFDDIEKEAIFRESIKIESIFIKEVSKHYE